MDRLHRRWISFTMIGMALLAITLACGASGPAGQPAVRTATPETQAGGEGAGSGAEPENAVEPTQVPARYLGDFTEAYGYALSGISIEDPALPTLFYEPKSDKRLIAVEVVLVNISGAPLRSAPLHATLLDSDGFTYDPRLAAVLGGLDNVLLHPSERVRGKLAFEIPNSATPVTLRFSTAPLLGRNLETSLEPPPAGHVPRGHTPSAYSPVGLAGLGDVVEEYGYTLSAQRLEDPAPMAALYSLPAGQRLFAIEVIVENTAGNTLQTTPLKAVLIDDQGFLYDPVLGARAGGEQLPTGPLNPGEKARGWIAFPIPVGANPVSLRYFLTAFDSGGFLETGLGR